MAEPVANLPGWRISPTDEPELRSQIQSILRSFNAAASVVGPDAEPLRLHATGDDGAFGGGLVAATYWRWLVIDVLAIEAKYRRRGLGSELVRFAEEIAIERGCTRAHTMAWAFQGLGFWRKRGYEVVGELDDYPEGHVLYWLRRSLV